MSLQAGQQAARVGGVVARLGHIGPLRGHDAGDREDQGVRGIRCRPRGERGVGSVRVRVGFAPVGRVDRQQRELGVHEPAQHGIGVDRAAGGIGEPLARGRARSPEMVRDPAQIQRDAVSGAIQWHPVASVLGIRLEAGDAVASQPGTDERRGARPLAGRRHHPLGGLGPALRAAAPVLGEVIRRGGQRQPGM